MELIAYSQRDERWAIDQLGFCENVTIGKKGCGLVCISILAGLYPDQANEILKERGGYSQGCVMKWDKAAEIFNLPRTDNFPKVAEVKLSGQQHFIVMLDDKICIDPLDGQLKTRNPYKILSWRNINPKQEEQNIMNKDEEVKDTFNQFKRVWVLLNHTSDGPNENSLRREAEDAVNRRRGGEEYAKNSYYDKWFKEAGLYGGVPEAVEKLRKIREIVM